MTIKNQSKTALTVQMYSDVFIKHFKCKPSEFKLTIDRNLYHAFAYYNNQLFQINPLEGMYEELMNILSDDPETVAYVELDILIRATTGITSTSDFLINLIRSINKEKELPLLQVALSLSIYSESKEQTFWNSLWSLDDTYLLPGKAVLAAVKTYGLETLTERMLQLQINDGLNIYNEIENGIFERVALKQGDEEILFYIYNISENTVII